ncbi:calcium channel YVC1 [Physcia stellaris]|nr:calcium channel YVC1 [Physcia stellaris]
MSSKAKSKSIPVPPKDMDYLVTRTGRRLNRKQLFNNRPFFPFLQLPPEVRNIIYRLVLVNNSSMIPVADMNYEKYHRTTVDSKRDFRRTSYWSLTHDDEELELPTNPNGDWTGMNKTTYGTPSCACHPGRSIVHESYGLLRLNSQIRAEALPIFYAENGFNFCGEWATVPFLQDRTQLARDSIRTARFFYILAADGHHSERQKRWIQNCKYIAANLPHLESLILTVMDFEGMLLGVDEKYKKKWMKWVPALMQIRNLKTLDVQIEISETIHYFAIDGDAIFDLLGAAEEKLLAVLRPKMLREEAFKCHTCKKVPGSALEHEVATTEEEETEEASSNESVV